MSDNSNTETASAAQDAAPSLKLDVTVRPIEPKGNLVGFANIKINDGFVVDDFKVLRSDKGLFVGMPSKPDGKGGYRDTARPITKEFREQLTGAVAAAYHEAVQKLQARAATVADAEKKTPLKEQIANGAKQAAKENAARPAPAKVSKAKSAEL